MAELDLTILMPCLNEAETLAFCVRQAMDTIRDSGIRGEVVVADNGSTDGSQAIALKEGARVVNVPVRGYGAALIAGIQAAHGKYIMMADADASYHFEHLPRFLPKLDEGYDLVMGNRFAGKIEPGAMPPLHKYLGNPVLSAIGQIFFRIPVRDFHCGLRAFRRDSILALNLRTTGMEFASEMVVKSSLAGLRMTEVPTTLSPDGRSRPPHLRSWRDGWRHLRFLLLYSPRWLFFYPGLAALLVGLVLTLAVLPGPLVVHFGGAAHSLDVDTLTYVLAGPGADRHPHHLLRRRGQDIRHAGRIPAAESGVRAALPIHHAGKGFASGPAALGIGRRRHGIRSLPLARSRLWQPVGQPHAATDTAFGHRAHAGR